MGLCVTTGSRNRRRHAFTLIEMMIVVIIIGLLAGLVAPQVIKKLGQAKKKTAMVQSKILNNACKDFYMDMDKYPEKLDDLVKDVGGSSKKWDGPYLDPAVVPKDPWGNEYGYKKDGDKGIEITSLGPDGVPSADDISSSQVAGR